MLFDAIIVGGGPAGVSNAIWLKQLGFNPVLIERQNQCGGLQLSNPYTNTWIASSANAFGHDIAQAMHMIRNRVEMRLGQEAQHAQIVNERVKLSITNGECIEGKFLVLAGGVSPKCAGFSNRIGLIVGPGTAVANTNFSGANVAILGGGDNAFENHKFISKRGASAVTIFARSIKARTEFLQQVPRKDIVVGPYEVDSKNRTVNGQQFDQIIVLYGYEVDTKSLLGLDIATRNSGFIWTNEECITSNEMVYAVGEITQRSHPCCVTSMADGVVAAKSIQRRLEKSNLQQLSGMVKRAIGIGSTVFAV